MPPITPPPVTNISRDINAPSLHPGHGGYVEHPARPPIFLGDRATSKPTPGKQVPGRYRERPIKIPPNWTKDARPY